MKRLHEFVKWFMYITTCVVFVCAVNLHISGEDTISANMLWQILLCGILTAVVTLLFRPKESDEGYRAIVKIIIHYIVLCAVMILYGCKLGWMYFSLKGIVMMMLSVAVVYVLVYFVGYWVDRKQADEINRRLKGKYSDKE